MKEQFLEYYDPTEQEVSNLWNEAVFIFDTNVLLNLYRYTESTRKDFLSALEELGEKLILPYQVGYEYHSNRIGVILNLQRAHSELLKEIKELFDKQISQNINKHKRHPSIEIESINSRVDQCLKEISEELDRQSSNHPDFKTKDVVLDKLTEIYENKVAPQPTKDDLRKIYSEGKERYEYKIPPGYKDLEGKKNKGERHLYGDLIIWKEVIEIAKKQQRPIVFITDDRKDDWWVIENGQTVRPRVELIKEFYDQTGRRILIYNADVFLKHAKEQEIASKIRPDSIQEVMKVRELDEQYYNNITKGFLSNRGSNFLKKIYSRSNKNPNFDKISVGDFGSPQQITMTPELVKAVIERYLELQESIHPSVSVDAIINAYMSGLESDEESWETKLVKGIQKIYNDKTTHKSLDPNIGDVSEDPSSEDEV